MLKALLIDDEPESLHVISSLIQMFCPNVRVIGQFTDPVEGKAAILSSNPDVVLLDIEMPGMTGLELLRQLPSMDFEVIFITAHNQYALNAIKLSALDYLLKPVDPAELETALQKAAERLAKKKTMGQFEVLLGLLGKNQSFRAGQIHKIALPTFEGLTYVKMENIIYIKADGGYCSFHFDDRPSLTISKNIGVFEESLEEYGFMRVHRTFIINLHHVKEFIRHDGGFLVLSNDQKAQVSNAKKEELLEKLDKL